MRALSSVRALALVLLAGACDLPAGAPARASGPTVVASDPADGDQSVDRAAVFRVFFDRRLLPGDVHRGNVAVESGARSAFVAPRFDPVDRALVIENAGAPLDPSVVWRLRVEDLHDLDGRIMREPWQIAFRTGELEGGEEPVPVPRFAEVGPILSARCATQGCHVAPDPVLGLDLSSAAGVRSTAIGVTASQTRVGVIEERPWYGTSLFAGLARIDVVAGVGRPAHSYLLYKVVGDPHVLGERMPPAPALALSPAELRLLSRWILAGAPTD